jgi:PAT family beta-lactamase induction signal transducer AmpG
VLHTAAAAFVEFLTRRDALAVLAFVVLFKLCDALAGTMTGPFVISIGFDKAAYAGIVKGVGLAATLIGGFLGGLAAKALPLTRALWIAAILQLASNFAFVWLAMVGVDHSVLAAAVAIENVTGGVGTVIFVAFLSSLCIDPRHTATQFALLTALAAVGRTVISASAGYIAIRTGWPAFFALTSLAGLPALALLWWLGRRGSVGTPAAAVPAPAG